MKFSLDYCEHRASQAGLGSSDNGRIMDKNCLLPVKPVTRTRIDEVRGVLWTAPFFVKW